MSISYEQLLVKIEQEVGYAKQAPTSQMREHLHSIRTLCDLALEDQREVNDYKDLKEQKVNSANSNGIGGYQPTPVYQQPVPQPVSIPQDKPIKMEDGSNGDSLFDF